MKYYLYSLEHHKILQQIGEPTRKVMVRGGYRPFTAIVKDPDYYKYSDVKVVAMCDDDEVLSTIRG